MRPRHQMRNVGIKSVRELNRMPCLKLVKVGALESVRDRSSSEVDFGDSRSDDGTSILPHEGLGEARPCN